MINFLDNKQIFLIIIKKKYDTIIEGVVEETYM